MSWNRKATRYQWGREKENQLRKLLDRYIPANCRSSRSGGLFDVWAAGSYLWLFQIKRTDNVGGYIGVRQLLLRLTEAVKVPEAKIYVAVYHRRKGVDKSVGFWRFYYLVEE